jgi:hypothetical protein
MALIYRYEKKYLVPNYMLDDLRARFSGFVRPDLYSNEDETGRQQYTVRSIYFDSSDLSFFNEKIAGVMDRRKLRVRGYNRQEPGSNVVLEIKKKLGDRILKHRADLKYDDLEKLLYNGQIERFIFSRSGTDIARSLDDASRFLFHYKRRQLRPTCLVVYEREAYHGKFNSDIRVTFDKNIRSRNYPAINQLFCESDLRPLFKEHFILEVKYSYGNMPDWIKTIIYEYRLRVEALSKYVIGYEVNTTFPSI